MKGDLEAMVLHWTRVLANVPRALLVLAGVTADRDYVGHLRQLARAVGAANRILVIDNPHELFPDARGSLMSAADVFVHPSTGIEEASPLAVHEAQAHALPIIAARWAGIPEVVTHGETGFLIDTRVAPLRPHVATTMFGETDRTHLVHAGRTVWCDWRAFVDAATALADEDRRAAMGAVARRREQSRDIEAVAREYVAVFDAASAAAEKAWAGPAPSHPLVHLDDVLAAQAAGTLEPGHRLRLADQQPLPLLTRGRPPDRRHDRHRREDALHSPRASPRCSAAEALCTPWSSSEAVTADPDQKLAVREPRVAAMERLDARTGYSTL